MQIVLEISDEKAIRLINAAKGLYKIPVDNEGKPIFTDTQWAKEKLRQFAVRMVYRWEEMEAIKTARELVQRINL